MLRKLARFARVTSKVCFAYIGFLYFLFLLTAVPNFLKLKKIQFSTSTVYLGYNIPCKHGESSSKRFAYLVLGRWWWYGSSVGDSTSLAKINFTSVTMAFVEAFNLTTYRSTEKNRCVGLYRWRYTFASRRPVLWAFSNVTIYVWGNIRYSHFHAGLILFYVLRSVMRSWPEGYWCWRKGIQ